MAVPLKGGGGEIAGAISISTSFRRFDDEARALIELVREAARVASSLLK